MLADSPGRGGTEEGDQQGAEAAAESWGASREGWTGSRKKAKGIYGLLVGLVSTQ